MWDGVRNGVNHGGASVWAAGRMTDGHTALWLLSGGAVARGPDAGAHMALAGHGAGFRTSVRRDIVTGLAAAVGNRPRVVEVRGRRTA